jgi:hypothetical protein
MLASVRALISILLLFTLSGCSDDDNKGSGFAGTYETTEMREGPCGSAQPKTITDGDKYFRLADEAFFGTPIVAHYDCTSPDACSDSMNLFKAATKDGNDWAIRITSSSGDKDSCSLGYTYIKLERVDDATIRFAGASHSFSGAVPDCSTDEAEKRGKTMDCTNETVTVAKKVR